MLAIFLDIETSGLDFTRHCILEIAFKIIDISTGQEKASYQSIVKQPIEDWEKRDPYSINVNGFTWQMLAQGKDSHIVSQEIMSILKLNGIERGKSVFICQNPAFDRSFFAHLIDVYTQEQLNWPYHWLDFASMYWALNILQLKQKIFPFLTKSIYQRMKLPAIMAFPLKKNHTAL